MDLNSINQSLRHKTPLEVVSWAVSVSKRPIVTTNFRPYEAALLHLVNQVQKGIKVIWCDTGYNTSETYRHANQLIAELDLNMFIYIPKQTVAYREVVLGIPDVDDPKHIIFTEQVKLEPFERAMSAHQPDVWFTNLRKGQTAFRDRIDMVSKGTHGMLKISPFYHWSDESLDQYLVANHLPNEHHYYDPTKQLAHRECGLHK